MARLMTPREKHLRREARTLGGWTAAAIRTARLNQIEADKWRAEYPGPLRESARIWLVRADERQEAAVEYARRAAHSANEAQALSLPAPASLRHCNRCGVVYPATRPHACSKGGA